MNLIDDEQIEHGNLHRLKRANSNLDSLVAKEAEEHSKSYLAIYCPTIQAKVYIQYRK